MGLKYTKRAMTSYEVHRFFHGLEISFFPDTFLFLIKTSEKYKKRTMKHKQCDIFRLYMKVLRKFK